MDEQLLAQSAGLAGDMLDISPARIAAMLIFSIIGMWMLRQGRKRSDWKIITISFALMFYTYLTGHPAADWGIGVGLCGLAYYIW